MSRRLVARTACLIALSLAIASPVLAQLQGARVVGTIFDAQHAGIPGATVTVTNIATNVARTATTDREGNYVVTPLDPGIYKVTAAVSGFQTTVREGIELTVGQAARVELTLAISALATEVLVTTQAPLLNTESATLSQVISNEQIVDLPLNGRSFHELARLTPGVALLAPSGNSQLVRPEIVNGNIMGGVSGRQTRFLLDGVDITEEYQGGTWIQTSVDALQEFSVQQNAYSAEFHGAGGTFNVVTKSGTNRFRGSAFEFLRNQSFDAKNFFAQTKEKLERNQFGGTFGGPVVIPGLVDGRDRMFFFASYEGQRRKSGAVDVAIVPSPAQRQGNFQGLAPIYDPISTVGTTRTQFTGNTIPQNRIAPAAEFFLRYIPLPNGPNNTWVSNPIVEFNQDQFTVRVDHELAARHRLFGRFSRHSNHEERPSTPGVGCDRVIGTGLQRGRGVDLELRHIDRPRVSFQPDVRRIPVDGVLSGAGFRPAGERGSQRAGAGAGPGNLEPARVLVLGLRGILGQCRRRPAEMAGSRRVRDHRQRDVGERAAHHEVRRPDLPPQHPVHRRTGP